MLFGSDSVKNHYSSSSSSSSRVRKDSSSTDSSASVKVNKDGLIELNGENGNSAKINGENAV